MMTFIIIFLIVATIFALATLAYVVVDYIIEKLREDKEEEAPVVVVAPIPVPVEPEPEPEPVPVPVIVHEIVEHIDAEEADEMMTDEEAMQEARYESGAGKGREGIINIGLIDKKFEANDVITLAVLKEKGLINKRAHRMKVLADGELNKPITVKSEAYSVQAIKMIELTGGKVIILKD